MLGKDLVRARNYFEHEIEPRTKKVYEDIYGIYQTLMYSECQSKKFFPVELTKFYPSPPFESPSMEFVSLSFGVNL